MVVEIRITFSTCKGLTIKLYLKSFKGNEKKISFLNLL